MLVITTLQDLKKYYKARQDMAKNQVNKEGTGPFNICQQAIVMAYEECIRGLDAYLATSAQAEIESIMEG